MTTEPHDEPRSTRRGVLLGVGLAGLGGALAGCSTAAVPYDANEAGVAPGGGSSSSSAGMMGTASSQASAGAMSGSAAGAGAGSGSGSGTMTMGTVLGPVSDVPVGSGKIYTDAKVVVTQPVKGKYKAFSAVCTHVGCILNQIADGKIDCPCHGSEFKITDGSLVTGPGNGPLPKKKVKIVDGKFVLL